jgi:hypothetical protein
MKAEARSRRVGVSPTAGVARLSVTPPSDRLGTRLRFLGSDFPSLGFGASLLKSKKSAKVFPSGIFIPFLHRVWISGLSFVPLAPADPPSFEG